VTRTRCARCANRAGFTVSAGDRTTFWHRSESVCLGCLPASKRWASFVGPVTVASIDLSGTPIQATLFVLGGREGDR
jgi:hypothetical protein